MMSMGLVAFILVMIPFVPLVLDGLLYLYTRMNERSFQEQSFEESFDNEMSVLEQMLLDNSR